MEAAVPLAAGVAKDGVQVVSGAGAPRRGEADRAAEGGRTAATAANAAKAVRPALA